MTTAKAGTLLCLDCGEYSDYYVIGFFVVLKDFDPLAEISEYIELNPEQKKDYNFDNGKFLAVMIAKGLLLEITYSTLFMGAYRCSEITFTP